MVADAAGKRRTAEDDRPLAGRQSFPSNEPQHFPIALRERREGPGEDGVSNRLQFRNRRRWVGSAYTLRSRDLGFGPKKLSALKQGLAVMDEAVAAAPNEPKVRLARALTTSALPAIFGRKGESLKDFELLAKEAERTPAHFDQGELAAIREHTPSAGR